MPVTYDSGTNTITIVGGTESNPYSFEDIYQADQANGWGKFTKLSEGVYKTTAKLCFGDGSTPTYFKEKGTVLIIDHVATKNWDAVIRFKAKCTATFGEKEEVNGKVVCKNGVEFIGYDTVYNTVILTHDDGSNVSYYGCKFKHISGSKRFRFSSLYNEAIGCLFEWFMATPTNAVIKNCVLIGEHGHITAPKNTTIEGVKIRTTMIYAFWITNGMLTFKNIDVVTTERLASVYRLQSPNIVKLINCKAMNWIVHWYLESGDVSGELQRIYAVRFKVTDIDGNPLSNRVIKVYDKNGNKVAEAVTDSNGLTDEVEILYAKLVNPYSDGTWHTFTDEDWEYFSPFTVEVWYGNELEYKGILTDLDIDSTYIQITVKPSSFTLDDVVNEIQAHRNEVEPKIDEKISTRASQTSVDNLANQLSTHDSDIKSGISNLSDQISAHDSDVKGTGFVKDTHSLVNIKEDIADMKSIVETNLDEKVSTRASSSELAQHDSDIKSELSEIEDKLDEDKERDLSMDLGSGSPIIRL